MSEVERKPWLRGDLAQEMLVVERWAKHMGIAEYRTALQVAADRARSTPEGSVDPVDRLVEWLLWVSAVAVARTTEASSDSVICSFCGRDRNAVEKLIAAPDKFICDVCVGEAAAAFQALEPQVLPSKSRCSFCRQKSKVAGAMFARAEARICKGCIGVCRDLMRGDGGVG